MSRTSKGYFTGRMTHKNWTASVLAYYYGSLAAFAREIEEKPATIHNCLYIVTSKHIGKLSTSDLSSTQIRIFSKICNLGFKDLLAKDNFLPEDFIPVAAQDIYWFDYSS